MHPAKTTWGGRRLAVARPARIQDRVAADVSRRYLRCLRIVRRLPSAATIARMLGSVLGHEGSVQDFLELSDADMEYIETRRALSRKLKAVREKLHLTQVEVAARLNTSQSRVAKMEKADPSVSADLLLQSLFSLGVKRKQLGFAV